MGRPLLKTLAEAPSSRGPMKLHPLAAEKNVAPVGGIYYTVRFGRPECTKH